MKVSLNAIRALNDTYHCSEDVTAVGTDELVDKIGAQLGAVEEVINLGKKYQGIVIAKIVSCDKHPDADKLSVCKIDDGGVVKDVERDEKGLVQVVCGAPNARADLYVAWLPPGATVPESYENDPYVLEAREIRGQKSNGMLASPKELALGESHKGILEIDGERKPGSDFAKEFKLDGEVVLDIENKMFTHRPDCFGLLGIFRELAGIQQMVFKSPDWYTSSAEIPASESQALPFKVQNELPELVPRFTAIAMSGVSVKDSPVWLQVALTKLGQKPINNIVDLTNFIMLLTGQPIHAYDYEKVKALSGGETTIVVRNPKPGEKVKLLNGKQIEPRAEAIMIATDKQLIGVGGVMGGSETEVDEHTNSIIIECASFDMYSTRRTAMAHGLFTEAVTRFTKGQSPLQNLAVLSRMVQDVGRLSGGKADSQLIDDNRLDKTVIERDSLYVPVSVSVDFINQRLGLQLTSVEIKQLLENVEFNVEAKSDDLTVKAPFWRTDIELREDVVEEVGRLYGYDHLPLELPERDLSPTEEDTLLSAKAQIRERLSRAGANEVLTYSFVHSDLLQKVGQDKGKTFEVANALSPDLQHYRVSLMPSLLEKVHPNIKAGYDEFALFEIGKTHSIEHVDDSGLPQEFEFTALVVTANDKLKKFGSAYYQARKYLIDLDKAGLELEFKPISDDMLQYPVVQPYDPNRSALVSIKDGAFLGIIGEFKPSVTRSLKLPKYTAGFEIDTQVWQAALSGSKPYRALPRFPQVTQDITLKVAGDMHYAELEKCLLEELSKQLTDESSWSLSPVDIFQPADAAQKNITFRLSISNHKRTLTDKEVSRLLDEAATAAKSALQAERV
jgi:phenylalanyl-tRNA synthetase beta chain